MANIVPKRFNIAIISIWSSYFFEAIRYTTQDKADKNASIYPSK